MVLSRKRRDLIVSKVENFGRVLIMDETGLHFFDYPIFFKLKCSKIKLNTVRRCQVMNKREYILFMAVMSGKKKGGREYDKTTGAFYFCSPDLFLKWNYFSLILI